ncbi:L,D-transpeptidase [Paracoccus spongiarum]|uniref:L,D-transpeptidase n=1 Tax=Paracoccus spongiarum TaxID=3064387 RepID=A0ABT9JFE2_9RHOB|nr:L,D-transpeptidase [Paracoccus sp. 2205BS29-5]MDP5308541.1 L,D-transpeptidase [Paracoccus sp. 2205BS29-5]
MRLVSLFAVLGLGLAACGPAPQTVNLASPSVPAVYQARTDTGPNGAPINIPAIRAAYLTERNQRQRVAYNGPEAPGTIVVDPYARVLYDVMENGEAMRFGVAVGRAGKGFSGDAVISLKKQWPSWTPTQNMIRTEPDLYGQFAGGLSGGVDNPLGSRALYLYRNGRDTYYRIHGTMDPSSIGKATSAGCIRLFNQDVMDLFDKTELGTRVKVRSQAESVRLEGPMIETPEGYVVPASEAGALAPQAAAATLVAAEPGFVSPVESAVPSR